jgi:hypothetical protein
LSVCCGATILSTKFIIYARVTFTGGIAASY